MIITKRESKIFLPADIFKFTEIGDYSLHIEFADRKPIFITGYYEFDTMPRAYRAFGYTPSLTIFSEIDPQKFPIVESEIFIFQWQNMSFLYDGFWLYTGNRLGAIRHIGKCLEIIDDFYKWILDTEPSNSILLTRYNNLLENFTDN